jgi:methyl-accepting chemotaxis protein
MTKKLLVAPVVAILFLAVFGIVAYFGLFSMKGTLDDVVKNRFSLLTKSADMKADLNYTHANVYKLMGWIASNYDKAKIEAFTKEQFDGVKQISDTIHGLSKSKNLTAEEKKYIDPLAGQLTKYEDLVRQVLAQDMATASILMSQADDQFQALNVNIENLLALESKLSNDRYTKAGSSFSISLAVLTVIFLAAVILPFLVSLVIKAVIITPIGKTVAAIKSVAEGDLTRRIEVEGNDEIGEMAADFNVLVEKFHEAIGNVARSSNEVSQAASGLDSASELMATGIEEASMQVNSVAAASEEMSKTSSEIAQNCVVAARSAEQANRSVTTGEAVISETIAVMNRINDRVTESAEVIKSLGVRSEQIGQIVGLINDVADQTNLLALNAAIEAARAGEHGRGFAVVADEVRKLAERTSQATKEISTTIQAMQTETKKAVSSMQEGVNEVETGTGKASESGKALQEILYEIGKVTGEINQIAVASEEETATANEIATNIQQISEVVRESARTIQENADASSRLAALSRSLQDMVNQFTF